MDASLAIAFSCLSGRLQMPCILSHMIAHHMN